MSKVAPLVSLAVGMLLAGCDGTASAEVPKSAESPQAVAASGSELPNLVLESVDNPDGPNGLRGWRERPRAGFKSRLVPDHPAFADARLSVVVGVPAAIHRGVQQALALEGIDNVSITRQLPLTGDYRAALMGVLDAQTGDYGSVMGTGTMDGKPVRFIGIWINSPGEGDTSENSASFEYFVAPPAQYVGLGGWLVPALRAFDLYLEDAPPMRAFGSDTDADQMRFLDLKFRTWVTEMVQQQARTAMMRGQILRMQQGLDQIEPRGMQDPMWDPNY